MACIAPVITLFAANVVIVSQKDKKRFCLDYRPINDASESESYPIPQLKDLLEFLKTKKIFSVLDNKLGYHQLKVHPNTQKYLAFQTQYGTYAWLCCPFGHKNLPGWYNFLMQTIVFVGLLYCSVVIYFDDAVVASLTFDEHIQDLRTSFSRYRKHKLKLRGTKCQLVVSTFKFHGFIIEHSTIYHDPQRCLQVFDIPRPTTFKNVERYLGLVNYFHAFIPNYSNIRKPLDVLKSNKPFKWTNPAIHAFYMLKTSIMAMKKLFHIDHNCPIYLAVDAATYGIGSYLFQVSLSHLSTSQLTEMKIDPSTPLHLLDHTNPVLQQPIGFSSHGFALPQMKWSNVVREAFAISYSILAFKFYLQGISFTVLTDHKNFLAMFTSTHPVVTHAFLKVQEYNFVLAHIAGILNVVPDTLSRLHTDPTPTSSCIATSDALTTFASSEPSLILSTNDVMSNEPPTFSPLTPASQAVLEETSSTTAMSSLPLTMVTPPGSTINVNETHDHQHTPILIRPIVPHTITQEHLDLLHRYHSQAGHFGVNNTLIALSRDGHFWKTLRRDTIAFITTCPICQMTWRRPRQHSIVKRTWESYDPFYSIVIDYLGPFTEDTFGYKYLFVVIDNFSRYVRIFPTKDATAYSAAIALLDICMMFSTVRMIASDQPKTFTSSTYRQLLLFLSAEPSYSLPYAHQTTVERCCREVLRHLRALTLSRLNPSGLPLLVIAPLIMHIINHSTHSDIGCTPHELIFALHADPSLYPLPNTPFVPPHDVGTFYTDLVHLQATLLQASREHQAANSDFYLLANTTTDYHTFQPNDYVFVTYPEGERPSSKDRPPIMGPYILVSITNNNCTVRDLITHKIFDVQASRLRIYHDSPYHAMSPRAAAMRSAAKFDIADIKSHRGDPTSRKTLEFLCSYTGFDESHDQWLPVNDVCRLPQMRAYLLAHPDPILRHTVNKFQNNFDPY
jgi:hypothetical protein